MKEKNKIKQETYTLVALGTLIFIGWLAYTLKEITALINNL